MRRLVTFLAWVSLFVVCWHVGWSWLLARAALQLNSERAVNIRHLDDHRGEGKRLLAAYLHDLRDPDVRAIAVFGSSVSWGYPFSHEVAFPKALERRLGGTRVLNLSIVGSDLSGIFGALATAHGAGLTCDVVVLECPHVNTIVSLRGREAGRRSPSLNHAVVEDITLFAWFLEHPWGLRHWGVIWDEYRGDRIERELSVAPLPPGYIPTEAEFDLVFEAYAEWIEAAIRLARRIAPEVHVFVSPLHAPTVESLGLLDRDVLLDQFDRTYRAVERVPDARAIRIEPAFLDDPGNFCNLTHLNIAGHRALAETIAASLEARSGGGEGGR